jgi:hypothetical protein
VKATSFRLGEPGSPEIAVRPDLFRGPSVAVNGQAVARARDGMRIYWPIPMADGSERRLFLAGQMTGLRAIVDGTEYPVERRLAPWEVVLAVAPIGLVPILVGGVGLLTGGIATGLAFALFRFEWSPVVRLAAWAVLTAVAAAIGYLASPLLR